MKTLLSSIILLFLSLASCTLDWKNTPKQAEGQPIYIVSERNSKGEYQPAKCPVCGEKPSHTVKLYRCKNNHVFKTAGKDK